MTQERYRWLAAIVKAQPDGRLVGRTRLQKSVWLLQRKGVGADYRFRIHYYGVYSDEIQADTALLEREGAGELCISSDGKPYWKYHVSDNLQTPSLGEAGRFIETISNADPVVLELAATFDAFRELYGMTDEEAEQRVRKMKGSKCDEGKFEKAKQLLQQLEL